MVYFLRMYRIEQVYLYYKNELEQQLKQAKKWKEQEMAEIKRKKEEEKKKNHALTQRTSSASSTPISNLSPSFAEEEKGLMQIDEFYEALHRKESHYSRSGSAYSRDELQKTTVRRMSNLREEVLIWKGILYFLLPNILLGIFGVFFPIAYTFIPVHASD